MRVLPGAIPLGLLKNFEPGPRLEKAVEYRIRWWPYQFRGGFRQTSPELETLKVSLPVGFIERPVYVELADIPLE